MNSRNKQEVISLAFVTSESHLIDAPLNSSWVDSGTCINVTNLLQGFGNKWKPSQDKADLIARNGDEVKVE